MSDPEKNMRDYWNARNNPGAIPTTMPGVMGAEDRRRENERQFAPSHVPGPEVESDPVGLLLAIIIFALMAFCGWLWFRTGSWIAAVAVFGVGYVLLGRGYGFLTDTDLGVRLAKFLKIGACLFVAAILATTALRGRNPAGTAGNATAVARPTTALHTQNIGPVHWGVIAGPCVARYTSTCEPISKLIRSREYQTIRCTYGPLNSDGSGYYIYDFWHGKAPPDPASYAMRGQDHPFMLLGTKTLDHCPATQAEASARFQEAHPYKEVAATSSPSN